MNVRTKVRTLAMAGALAVVIMTSPAGLAFAAPRDADAKSCRAAGYVWDAKKGCSDKRCPNGGFGAKHGDERVEGRYPNLRTVYRCDGFTGNWVKVRTEGDGLTVVPMVPEYTFELAP